MQIVCPSCRSDVPLRTAEGPKPFVKNLKQCIFTLRCKRCKKIVELTGETLGYREIEIGTSQK